jgi:putative transposase
VNGRKRHILVDTMGLLMKAQVHPADVQDRVGIYTLLAGIKKAFPRLSLIWADQAYNGKPLKHWIEDQGFRLQVVNRPRKWVRVPEDQPPPELKAFVVLPRRWVVERTFAWLGRNRRLAKDYEGLTETEEAWLYLAMIPLMLKRLTL